MSFVYARFSFLVLQLLRTLIFLVPPLPSLVLLSRRKEKIQARRKAKEERERLELMKAKVRLCFINTYISPLELANPNDARSLDEPEKA